MSITPRDDQFWELMVNYNMLRSVLTTKGQLQDVAINSDNGQLQHVTISCNN